jgi:hypothetical protein
MKKLLLIFTQLLITTCLAQDSSELKQVLSHYSPSLISANEEARERYILDLTALLQKLSVKRNAQGHPMDESDSRNWQSIANEIIKYPYPPNIKSQKLSQMLVGKWQGSRHAHEYRSDGTVYLIDDLPPVVWDKWKIQGNTLQGNTLGDMKIILINREFLITSWKDCVFVSNRIDK